MSLPYSIQHHSLLLPLSGDYIHYDDEVAQKSLLNEINSAEVSSITINAEQLGQWDSTLAALLYEVITVAKQHSLNCKLESFPKDLHRILDLAFSVNVSPKATIEAPQSFLEKLGSWGWGLYQSSQKGIAFMRECFHSVSRLFLSKAIMRRVDFLFALGDGSYKAVAIVSLVSFMVGLILAFVGAIQLKNFGAQIYVASLVAIGMIRIMGAIMAGIVMSGRTGASYAATIGTMQVNEEIDALKTMGIPITDFLVLPRLMSLVITMPFLTMLADLMGMLGGGAVGVLMLNISPEEYWKYTLLALNMTNFMVGIFHGFVYGFVISICGCYYGVNCGRNADSVGTATTRAVVSSIVWMIVVTGFLTACFEVAGI